MAIYKPAPDAEIEEKKPEQAELIQAVKQETFTKEEVLAMLAQVQKGVNK